MPASVVTSRRLEWLQTQRENTLGEITAICDRAVAEDRDLSDAEQSGVEERRSSIERYDRDLAVEAELGRSNSSYAELAAELGPALARTRPSPDQGSSDRSSDRAGQAAGELYRSSPGAYLVDYLLRSEDPARAERFEAFHRAAPHQITSDNPGIIPTPILGPVWTSINARRPAVEAATTRPMPAGGKTFIRPHVTQHTLVGDQPGEKQALPSQPLKIDPITVTKRTKGGYVNLSFQDRDWSDPSIMDVLLADLAAMYAQSTDAQFCLDFLAAVTQTQPVATNDAEGWLNALYSAAATVYDADNSLPTTLWTSTDVWATLGALVDGSGRPLFPTMAPANALGDLAPGSFTGSIAGMRIAVDANFAAGTAVVGDSNAVEFYEQVGGQVQATEPSLLGTNIAFYGYMADCVVSPPAFVKLTPPAGTMAAAGAAEKKTAEKK